MCCITCTMKSRLLLACVHSMRMRFVRNRSVSSCPVRLRQTNNEGFLSRDNGTWLACSSLRGPTFVCTYFGVGTSLCLGTRCNDSTAHCTTRPSWQNVCVLSGPLAPGVSAEFPRLSANIAHTVPRRALIGVARAAANDLVGLACASACDIFSSQTVRRSRRTRDGLSERKACRPHCRPLG